MGSLRRKMFYRWTSTARGVSICLAKSF